jgi:uncharacterized protein YegL
MKRVDVTVLGPKGAAVRTELDASLPVEALLPRLVAEFNTGTRDRYTLRTETNDVIPLSASLSSVRTADGHRLLLVAESKARPRSVMKRLTGRGTSRPLSGYRVLPCYLAIDTSSSMNGKPIDDINVELPRLVAKMRTEVLLAEICQVGLVTFDGEATTKVKLAEVMDMKVPSLSARVPRTNYAAVFNLLRERLAEDLYELYITGRRPYRPAVFFLSDGHPNAADWLQPLERLTDRSEFYGAPNIVAFGFGDANEQIVTRIGTRGAYMKDQDGAPSARLDEFMSFLLSSLTRSIDANREETDDDILTLPAQAPSGWRPIRLS